MFPGDEIARELGNFKIIYGVRAPAGSSNSTDYSPASASDADWHVGIIAESEGYGNAAEEGWKPAATFPSGRYDGIGYPVQTKEQDQIPSDIEDENSDDDSTGAGEGARLLGSSQRS